MNEYIVLEYSFPLRKWTSFTKTLSTPLKKYFVDGLRQANGSLDVYRQRTQNLTRAEFRTSSKILCWQKTEQEKVYLPVLERTDNVPFPPNYLKSIYIAEDAMDELAIPHNFWLLKQPSIPVTKRSDIVPKRIAELVAKDAIEKGEECPIMMLPLELKNTSVTSCYHAFESGALQQWMSKNKQCPVCKTECVVTNLAQII